MNFKNQLKFFDQHDENYYNPDNHLENVKKFSLKKYFHQVFEYHLDEALYLLEKEQGN
jgi:hypothetical protein